MTVKGIRSEEVHVEVKEVDIVKALYSMLGFRPGQYLTNEGICHSEDHGCSHSYVVDVLDSADKDRVELFKALKNFEHEVSNNKSAKDEVKLAFNQRYR